jgi:SIT4-associating protein SAP185/190
MRLGYLGHLTLIAEEVVKFTDRHAHDNLSQAVLDKVSDPDWIHYVEHTLAETRERDNAILGGVRPDANGPRQAVLNAVNAQMGFGNGTSQALVGVGLTGGLDSLDVSNGAGGLQGNNIGSSLLSSGFGSSSDEEDEEIDEDGEDNVFGTSNNSDEVSLDVQLTSCSGTNS